MSLANGALLAGTGPDQDNLTALTPEDMNRAPRGVIPRFRSEVIKTADGRFVDREYVEYLIPGDAKSIADHIVTDEIRNRFPQQYRAWKSGRELPVDGTPLEMMLGNTAVVHTLRSQNVFVIEQLATLTDGQLDPIGLGARDLREQAKRFIKMKSQAKSAAEVKRRDDEIAELKAQVATLAAQLAGRPVDVDAGNAPVDANNPPEGAKPVTGDRPNLHPGRGR